MRRKLRQGKLSISVVVAAVTSTFFTSICVHTWSRTGDSHCLCSRGHILSAFQCTLDRFLRVPSNPQASLRLRRRRYLFVRRLVVWMGIVGLGVACRMEDQSMLAAPVGNNDVRHDRFHIVADLHASRRVGDQAWRRGRAQQSNLERAAAVMLQTFHEGR